MRGRHGLWSIPLVAGLAGLSLLGAQRLAPNEDLKRDLQAIRQALKNSSPERPAPRWLHIIVDDFKEETKVRVNLPVEAVVAFLELAIAVQEKTLAQTKSRMPDPADRTKADEILNRQLESMERSLDILRQIQPRQWVEWLKDLPNGEIVTVDSKDARIRIWVE
ncbi:MAG: hypothetical protein NZ742_01860 [Acidobacteria bacterium]|nr:hypothetical protein [Acidobacteriota bacterium]MDW7983084.1 hypothetical protein [Acidobacteriota bacterium]